MPLAAALFAVVAGMLAQRKQRLDGEAGVPMIAGVVVPTLAVLQAAASSTVTYRHMPSHAVTCRYLPLHLQAAPISTKEDYLKYRPFLFVLTNIAMPYVLKVLLRFPSWRDAWRLTKELWLSSLWWALHSFGMLYLDETVTWQVGALHAVICRYMPLHTLCMLHLDGTVTWQMLIFFVNKDRYIPLHTVTYRDIP